MRTASHPLARWLAVARRVTPRPPRERVLAREAHRFGMGRASRDRWVASFYALRAFERYPNRFETPRGSQYAVSPCSPTLPPSGVALPLAGASYIAYLQQPLALCPCPLGVKVIQRVQQMS